MLDAERKAAASTAVFVLQVPVLRGGAPDGAYHDPRQDLHGGGAPLPPDGRADASGGDAHRREQRLRQGAMTLGQPGAQISEPADHSKMHGNRFPKAKGTSSSGLIESFALRC